MNTKIYLIFVSLKLARLFSKTNFDDFIHPTDLLSKFYSKDTLNKFRNIKSGYLNKQNEEYKQEFCVHSLRSYTNKTLVEVTRSISSIK